jgi:FtsP/CotA-like multicopper oxidase with cupredoxin domain
VDRRTFIKYSGGGLTSVALGGTLLKKITRPAIAAQTETVTLFIEAVNTEMVDHTFVIQWAFKTSPGRATSDREHPLVPGPCLEVPQGGELHVSVTNNLDEDHAFAIAGLPRVDTGPNPLVVRPGQTGTAVFSAAAAGTYLYLDPLNAPVNRVLGLHGALVVLPPPGAVPTPYNPASVPRKPFETSPKLRKLFDDLGAANTRFNFISCQGESKVGEFWRPDHYHVWLFSQIDPRFNRLAAPANAPPINADVMSSQFLPRYFCINGRSGFAAAHDADTAPHGRLGEPVVIRCLNAGICTHSPHIHGNHVYQLAERKATGELFVSDNIFERDSWGMKPGCVVDVLLPYEVPPDIWPWPPKDLRLFTQQLPLLYAMHCHTEMSQTAAGGRYPHGAITHWQIDEA